MYRQIVRAVIPNTVGVATISPANAVGDSWVAATPGNLLVAIHGFATNPIHRTRAAGWTEISDGGLGSRSTFEGISVCYREATGTETNADLTFGTNATSNVNCLQELTIMEFAAPWSVEDAVATDSGGPATQIAHGTTTALSAGTKAIIAAVRLLNPSGGWGPAPAGYAKLLDEATQGNDRMSVVYRDVTATTGQTTTQTWTTSGGAAGVIAAFNYTPVVSTLEAIPVGLWPLTFGTDPTPPSEVVKLNTPLFADSMALYVNADRSAARNRPQTEWDRIATWYRAIHFDGHEFEEIIDSDGVSIAEKFEMGRTQTHWSWVYVNGSYTTQGRPWDRFGPEAHAERNAPLGLSVLDTTTSMTLASALTATGTTIQVRLPTQRMTGLTDHPSGTPAAWWPLFASTIPAGIETYSQSTSKYASVLRIGDEDIMLPPFSTGGGGTGVSPQEPTGANPSPQALAYPGNLYTSTNSANRTITDAGGSIYCKYPTSGGQIITGRPLVMIGHGSGASASAARDSHQFLVNAGYIVACPDIGSMPPQGTSVLDKARRISSALTSVLADSVIGPAVLTNRIGYTGGSQGGIVGIALQDPLVRDPRLKVFVLKMSMISGSSPSWGGAMPLLFFHGSADAVVPYSSGVSAFNSATSPKGFIRIEGAGHDLATGTDLVARATKGLFRRFLDGVTSGWPTSINDAVAADPNASLLTGTDWTLDPGSGTGTPTGDWSVSTDGAVVTINNVVRGWSRTERKAYSSGQTVFGLRYIGSNAAAEADKILSGNPIVNSTGQLRYGLAFYDSARKSEHSQHNANRIIADLTLAEQRALDLSNAKQVTAASADTITANAHGLTNGTWVEFGGSDIPGGVRSWTPYVVRDATTNTFKVARTVGGPPIEINRPAREWAFGTWVLQQITSPTQLTNLAPTINPILALPGITGLSMRIPWDVLEQYPELPDQAYSLTQTAGKKLSLRFMAGEHTPSRLFTAGAYSYQSNLAAAGQPTRMATIPKGFSDVLSEPAGNPVFEAEFEALTSRLATWSRDRGIRLLHSAWYGWKWSEWMNGPDLIAAPGYTWARSLEGHARLARINKKYAGYGLMIENAVSGHYDDPAVNEYNELTAMLSNVYGYDSDWFITQGNNMSDQAGTMGKPAAALRLYHAKQSVDATANSYNWAAIYDAARANDWSYIEFYTGQFSGGTSAALKTEAADWAAEHTYTPRAITDCWVAPLRRPATQPVASGTEFDVTSVSTYNNADAWGNDTVNTAAIKSYPYSFVKKATITDWGAEQIAKRPAVQQEMTDLGLSPSHRIIMNNALAQPGQVAGGERMNMVRAGAYDTHLFEHGSMEPGSLAGQMTQLDQIMGENLKATWWLKTGDWKGGVFTDANKDQYLRLGYGMWLLSWLTTATRPMLLLKPYGTSVTERPSDTAGRELFFWDLGVPSAARTQPSTNLYLRQWTKGLVLVNLGSTSRTYTLPAGTAYLDANSEVGRNGILTRIEPGTTLTIPAYDMRMLLRTDTTQTGLAAPSGLSIGTVTQTSIAFSWQPVTGASGYEVRLNGGTATLASGTAHTFSGLTAATTYSLEVRSVSGLQVSGWAAVQATTSAAATLAAPTNLAASNITTTEARITWDAVAGASGYQIRVDGGANTPVGGTARLLTGLTPGATHNVEVRAIAGTTVGPWAALAVTMLAARADLALKIGGVWLLQQSAQASSNYLTSMRTGFTTVPSSVGFGLRFPLNQVIDASGNLITGSTGLLTRHAEAVKTINTERGRNYRFSLRPIAGQYTPAAWLSAMDPSLVYTTEGSTGIHPAYNQAVTHQHDGEPVHSHAIGDPNDMYLARWRNFLQQLIAWRETNGYQDLIPFIHGTYFSLEYSEYYYGPIAQTTSAWQANQAVNSGTPTRRRPTDRDPNWLYECVTSGTTGGTEPTWPTTLGATVNDGTAVWRAAGQNPAVYSSANHRAAHLELATVMHEELPDDIAVEWAATGHGPMVGTWTDGNGIGAGDNPFIEDMVAHLVSLYGAGSDRVYFSLNGWNANQVSGAPDATTEWNKQYASHNRTEAAIRLELQDIAASQNFNWNGTSGAFRWAYGGADDTLPAYSGAMPPRRSLGKAFNGGADAYRTRGVVPIEVYLFRATGTTGNAVNSAQLEPEASAFRTHILNTFS